MSIQKRGRGRPRKSASQRKENRLDTYLNDALFEWVSEKCDEAGGLSHSEFVSMVIAKARNQDQQGNFSFFA